MLFWASSPIMKKVADHVLFLQDVEDLRRPRRVGPVVEAEGYLIGMIAGLVTV